MDIYSQLKSAQIENVTSDPTPTAATVGRVIYRTDTDEYKICDSTPAWRKLFLSLDESLTFEGLASTPGTNPASGKYKVYFKTDGKPYYLDENGDEFAFGTGSGSGTINYLVDANKVDNDWTDSSGDMTISENAVTAIDDVADLKISKAAADASGDYVSYAFTSRSFDNNKYLSIGFDFKTDSNYEDDDYEVEIYDVTNAAVISNAAPEIKASELGNTYRSYFAASDSESYEFRIKAVTTSATASTLQVDNLFVSPMPISVGAEKNIAKFYLSATQTVSTTAENEVEFNTTKFNYGGKVTNDGSGVFTVKESGVYKITSQIQTSDYGSSGETYRMRLNVNSVVKGYNYTIQGGVTYAYTRITDSIELEKGDEVSIVTDSTSDSSYVVGGGEGISFIIFEKEISSGAEVVSVRDIIARVKSSAISQSVSDNGVAKVSMGTETVLTDTAGMWDSTNEKMVVPESGYYDVYIYVGTTSGSGDNFRAILYINGTQYIDGGVSAGMDEAASGNTSGANVTFISIPLEKGDELELYTYVNDISGSSSVTITQGVMDVAKRASMMGALSPFQDTPAYLHAKRGTAQSFPSGTPTTVLFNTELDDNYNGYDSSTGEYTIQRAGLYTISWAILLGNASWTAGESLVTVLNKNSTDLAMGRRWTSTGSSSAFASSGGTITLKLEKGDTLDVEVNQAQGSSVNLHSDTKYNYFTVIEQR